LQKYDLASSVIGQMIGQRSIEGQLSKDVEELEEIQVKSRLNT
jgi:hypothetical protein